MVDELPALVVKSFNVSATAKSISGHSMGGHGALTVAMSTGAYVSVSAFAPICHPTKCPWGDKAFTSYLGSTAAGAAFDATELMLAKGPFPALGEILVDQGDADGFLEKQLLPQDLVAACKAKGQPLRLRTQKGYDHSYHFIATFVADHVAFHATRLREAAVAAAEAAQKIAKLTPPTPAAAGAVAGQPIKCKAMVAWKAKEPLKLETIVVAPPRAGEVRVKVVANALCHTDVFEPRGKRIRFGGAADHQRGNEHGVAARRDPVRAGVHVVGPGPRGSLPVDSGARGGLHRRICRPRRDIRRGRRPRRPRLHAAVLADDVYLLLLA